MCVSISYRSGKNNEENECERHLSELEGKGEREMNAVRLGKNLQKHVFSHETSVEFFSGAIGVNRKTVYRWFKGTRVPSLEMMIRVSKKLGVSLDDLTEGV